MRLLLLPGKPARGHQARGLYIANQENVCSCQTSWQGDDDLASPAGLPSGKGRFLVLVTVSHQWSWWAIAARLTTAAKSVGG